jgi:hypothetical protein
MQELGKTQLKNGRSKICHGQLTLIRQFEKNIGSGALLVEQYQRLSVPSESIRLRATHLAPSFCRSEKKQV